MLKPYVRAVLMLAVTMLLFMLGACSSGTPPTGGPAAPDPSVTPADVERTAPESAAPSSGQAACEDPFGGRIPGFPRTFWEGRTNFCLHSVPYNQISNGNPRPDGIPAIDDPVFESVAEADLWLGDEWPVMVFEWQGEARAYPLAILIWHEIVNDVVGGEPVTLTFCPLCNATLAFRRTLADGRVLDFGTTGNLRNSDLVMYDRQTFSWWQQFTGEAIVGDLTGTPLDVLPSQIIAWSDFKSAHPEGDVLSRNTGHVRDYGRNPYPGYDSIDNSPFFPVEIGDDRLPAMERVVAFELNGEHRAYPFSRLRAAGAVNDEVASQPVAVFWKAGTVSTFGNSGPDTGSTGAFKRVLDDRNLTFVPVGDAFRDLETDSTWTILGMAVEGPLAGRQLERLLAGEHFWFAWVAFVPSTQVWAGD